MMRTVYIFLLSVGISSSVIAEPIVGTVGETLENLTWTAWTDQENWDALAQGLPQLARDVGNGNFEPYLEASVDLVEQVLVPIDRWNELSAPQRAEFLTGLGYYTIASILALKLGVVLAHRTQNHSRNFYTYLLRRAGYQMGPAEPAHLPGFLNSEAYEQFIKDLEKSRSFNQKRRKNRRKIKAYFRAQSIFIATKIEAYNVNEPGFQFDFSKWRDKLAAAYSLYRERLVNRRWEQMPKKHYRFFGRPTPHLDEVLKTIVDFTRDTLTVQEQRKLLSYLEALAYDFSRPGRPQDRELWSKKIARYIRNHREEFIFWRSEVQRAVRSDDLNPLARAMGIPTYQSSETELQEISSRMRANFSRLICETGFRWLGSSPLIISRGSADRVRREEMNQKVPARASK